MTEVIPGIFQLKLPLPARDILLGYVNVYLVKGDNGYLLIDTGWNTEEAFASLKNQLAEIGIGIEDISRVVVTHVHPDHYGLAGRLKGLDRIQLCMHELERDTIKSRYQDMESLLQKTGQRLHTNGVPPDELPVIQTASVAMARFVVPTSPDITFHGGETISTGLFNFKVLLMPGHSPGHICLYEKDKKVLLCGDHILPTITPNIGLHPLSGDNPLGDYFDSLNTAGQLDVDLALPGHENPFSGLQRRTEELIAHHRLREAKILETIQDKEKNAYQISNEITWISDTNGISWRSLAPLHKRLAILETLAHLEQMRFSGEVNKFARGDIIYYRSAK